MVFIVKQRKEDEEKLFANRHTLHSTVQRLQTFSSGWTGGQTPGTFAMKVLIRKT